MRLNHDQEQFFYSFRLDGAVPNGHPVREVASKGTAKPSAAWTDEPKAADLLSTIAKDSNTPAYVRASAMGELAPYISSANIDVAKAGLNDPDPMVRIGALDMLESVPPSQIWQLAAPLLWDSSPGVRIKAVDLLAAVPTANLLSGLGFQQLCNFCRQCLHLLSAGYRQCGNRAF